MQIEHKWVGPGGQMYKVVDGVSYRQNTPDDVIRVLVELLTTQKRVTIYYDNQKGYIYNQTGYVRQGLLNGKTVLNLHYNKTAYYGHAINGENIVKITSSAKPYKVYYERSSAPGDRQVTGEDVLARIMKIAEEVESL